MFFTQETYVPKIFERFGMQNTKRVKTFITKNDILVNADPSYQVVLPTITWYQQSVNSLMYVMTQTWLDIDFAVSIISQFANNPSPKHVSTVKHIF